MKKCFGILAASLLSTTVRSESVTAESAPFDFDASESSVLTAPLTIGYSPKWIGEAYEPGSSVEIVAVSHPGLFNASTSAVHSAAADVSGQITYTPTGDATPVRLVMKVVKDNVVIGTLERDVLLGETYQSSELADVDTRTDSLQRVVDAMPGSLPVAYDLGWFGGAESVKLEALNRTTGRGGPVVDSTNTLAVLSGSAGDFQWADYRIDGTTSLRLTPLDGSGEAIADPLVSSPYFIKLPRGLMLILR